jgi:hypothetical protein
MAKPLLWLRWMALACLVGPSASSREIPVRIEALAIGGAPAPGLPAGVQVSFLGYPILGAAGDAAFSARLYGPGIDSGNDEGLWLARANGEPFLVLREGDPFPGLPSASLLAGIGLPAVDATGAIVFSEASGFWLYDGAGTPVLVLPREAPAPDEVDGVVYAPSSLWVNDANHIAFIARLSGPGIRSDPSTFAFYRQGSDGAPVLVARIGKPAPGLGPLDLLRNFGDFEVNDAGEVAFWASWVPYATPLQQGIFGPGANGAPSLVAVVGTQAPGLPAGAKIEHLRSSRIEINAYLRNGGLALNRFGDVAFVGRAAGRDVLWVHRRGGETIAAAVAGSGPLPAGVATLESIRSVVMNGAGRIAFVASVRLGDGSFHDAIFQGDGDGAWTLVALDGRRAPYLPSGFSLSEIRENIPLRLNERGDLLFFGYLHGPDGARGEGIFLAPAGGRPVAVFTTLQPIELGGSLRSPWQLASNTQRMPGKETLDEGGRAVFHVRFLDSREAILRATVPVFDDADSDGFPDLIDDCPDLPNAQGDLDADGLGDACDPYPQDADTEKGQLRLDLSGTLEALVEIEVELAATDEALVQCLDQRFFVDEDGDGEDDATDACPATPFGQGVDDAGCSIEQFCGSFDPASHPPERIACLRADWRGDEPQLLQPDDCAIDPGAGPGASNPACVARTGGP